MHFDDNICMYNQSGEKGERYPGRCVYVPGPLVDLDKKEIEEQQESLVKMAIPELLNLKENAAPPGQPDYPG